MKILPIILFLSIHCFNYAATIQSAASGNWGNTSTWVGGIVPTQNDEIEIVSGHAITLNANAQINNIVITNGSIAIGSYTLQIFGSISGTQKNNVSSTANSTLIIDDNGNAPQFTFPSNITKLKKLVMNRANGAETNQSLDLDDNVPADSIVLVLTNGILYMNNESIFYMNSQAIKRNIPCSNASHIDGPVQRDIKKNSGMHVFPIGDNGMCRPMAIEAQNGTNNINQAQFIYATPPNNLNVNTSKLPGGIFQYFYWDHQLISSANTQRRFYFQDSDFPGISENDIANSFYLANSSGTTEWTIPTTPRTVDNTNNWISFSNSNASNDRYWTFGSNNINVQIDNIILPIELIFFDASVNIGGIVLDWATASETNNEYFIVQRSVNGIDFTNIATINGAGNSYNTLFYSYVDDNVKPNYVYYYRLQQIDYNGNFSFSPITSIYYKYDKILCSLLPYKKNIWHVKVKGNTKPNIQYSIFDINGKLIENKSIDMKLFNESDCTIDFSKYSAVNAMYFIVISVDNQQFQHTIIVQP
ncbi:MAG TPA: hypothetical protein PLS12_07165 [Bacteroidales bacterium]|nr:hypothetical protein [Bacteroidales bacterium]